MFWSSVSWPHQTLLNCCWVRRCPQGSHGVVVTRSVKSMCLKEGMACVEWLPPLWSLISIRPCLILTLRPCLILTLSVRPKMGTYQTIKTCSRKQRFPKGIWGCPPVNQHLWCGQSPLRWQIVELDTVTYSCSIYIYICIYMYNKLPDGTSH